MNSGQLLSASKDRFDWDFSLGAWLSTIIHPYSRLILMENLARGIYSCGLWMLVRIKTNGFIFIHEQKILVSIAHRQTLISLLLKCHPSLDLNASIIPLYHLLIPIFPMVTLHFIHSLRPIVHFRGHHFVILV